MKIPGDGYLWAFPAQVPRLMGIPSSSAPRAFHLKEPTTFGDIRQKGAHCTRGGLAPLPLPLPPRRTPQTCCFSPGCTSQSALSYHHNPVQKKMHFRHFSMHFLSMCVSNVCNGIDKVSMKGVCRPKILFLWCVERIASFWGMMFQASRS